jgi:hypothetical protein
VGGVLANKHKGRPLDGQLVEVEDAGTNEAANSSLIVLSSNAAGKLSQFEIFSGVQRVKAHAHAFELGPS